MPTPDYSFTLVPTHISMIKAGDTVDHKGRHKTVCSRDLKRCKFMGVTLFGDSYRAGTQDVLKVVIGVKP